MQNPFEKIKLVFVSRARGRGGAGGASAHPTFLEILKSH